LAAIGSAFGGRGARVLDLHVDHDHHRAVFTLAGEPGSLAGAVVAGAREAVERIDLRAHAGEHPRVGVVDVAPFVYLGDADRGAACAEALVAAHRLGNELELPVYLYGALAGGRTRATLRRGGLSGLADVTPDYGPPTPHPSAGVVLVAARPPLIAFNVELARTVTPEQARTIAARIREGGEVGLPGVRALGLVLPSAGIVQISTNIEDHELTSPAAVVAAVARHAQVAGAELVGLAPAAAFADFPASVPLRGLRTIEQALGA
jgi:glutamate formiminotransferase / 5-formyltetrahydrofolate cyclo-ligase